MRDGRYVACLILLLVVVLLNLPLPVSMRVKSATRDNIAPFENFMSLVSRGVRKMFTVALEKRRAEDERRELLEDNISLRYQIRQLRDLERDNERLREQLGFKRLQKHSLVLCEVGARGDASGWWQTVTLNRGEKDGIGPNMAVVTPKGLIGRTMKVSQRTCTVLLITDPNCKVACKLRRIDVPGIVRGRGVRLDGEAKIEMLSAARPCRMDYISKNHKVVENDAVVTSGLGGVFPEGLVVGRVAKVDMDVSGLYQIADIAPAAELGTLKYAFVVID